MARLVISKDCLADYAKLDKDVQRAVDQAVATFARHPQPCLQLERPPHIQDGRLRILPVDSRWRGVVLTAGDMSLEHTFSLVTVLPQDQADAYVISHRFSFDRTTEILEVRDEEAVGQLQPSLHAPLEGEPLPVHVSHAGLARPGAPTQILPAVRLLATEEALEALQTALPDAQHATLSTLAGGPTVDEAELAQVTPVSRRGNLPFRLAHPFAAWRRFRARSLP